MKEKTDTKTVSVFYAHKKHGFTMETMLLFFYLFMLLSIMAVSLRTVTRSGMNT